MYDFLKSAVILFIITYSVTKMWELSGWAYFLACFPGITLLCFIIIRAVTYDRYLIDSSYECTCGMCDDDDDY